jgi:drug/metabolite transporter (DMT)-like permease
VTALGMAIFSTVIPSFMISAAIKNVGPNTTSILSSIGPVATIIMGVLILGEDVDTYQIMGTGVVIIGITIVSYRK